LSGICVCLALSTCAATSAVAQNQTEVKSPPVPSNSVIDENLTWESQNPVASVTQASELAPLQDATQIRSVVSEQGCGCQQTTYHASQPYLTQTYSNQVFSGNSFTTSPVQQYRTNRTYLIPRGNAVAPGPPRQNPLPATRQYYGPQQSFGPVRRGLLFNRFRR